MWKQTLVEVVKVKDVDTGGKPTMFEEPVMLDYNFGRGFLVGKERKDVIKRPTPPTAKAIPETKVDSVASFRPDFDNEKQLPPTDKKVFNDPDDIWDTIPQP
jgi:hypothetical protein